MTSSAYLSASVKPKLGLTPSFSDNSSHIFSDDSRKWKSWLATPQVRLASLAIITGCAIAISWQLFYHQAVETDPTTHLPDTAFSTEPGLSDPATQIMTSYGSEQLIGRVVDSTNEQSIPQTLVVEDLSQADRARLLSMLSEQ